MSPAHRQARLTELDGLRGLAALGVAIFHLMMFLGGTPNPIAALPGTGWLLAKGWHLVDLFFVLSGFIFSHCYLRDGRMRPGVGGNDFAWARFARLWPLHAVMLCFAALVLIRHPGTTALNFATSLAMGHVFLADMMVLNPPAWSLSVECICYAAFALLALNGKRGTLTVGSVAAVALGAWLIVTDAMPHIGRGLFGFFIGCLAYRYHPFLARAPWPVLGALFALPFAIDLSRHQIMLESALSWPAAVLLAARVGVLNTTPFQWLGARSYAIYLAHVPLYLLLRKAFATMPGIPAAVGVAICLSTLLLLSDHLHRRLEMPAQAFLLHWRASRSDRRIQFSA